jgi:peptide/nickel transport system substrate-binding protein
MRRLIRWSLSAALLGMALPSLAAPLRYAEDQAPGIINPLFTTTMVEARVNELLFDGLYTDNEDLATQPAVVQSAKVEPDGMGMTLTLREDVFWHDGTAIQADDVVFSIQAMKNPKTLSTEAGRVEWIDSAEALDENTVRLRFNQAQFHPQDRLYFKILPKNQFESTQVNRTHPFRTRPIGTGPYRLESYNDDNSVTFAANPDYRKPLGVSELILREVADKSYQAKLIQYESLEALIRVMPQDLAELSRSRKIELYPYQTNSWWFMGFNQTRAPFNDPRVRQALSQMVDVENLLAPIGTGEVLSGPYVKSSPFYNHDVSPWAHDPYAASNLLEEAGFTREDGMWSRNGKPLRFTLTFHQNLETSQKVVINLQSQLRSEGVEVVTEALDEAEWKARVWRKRNFDCILSQWSFDRNEDVYAQFHSKGERNFSGYANEKVDELLDKARAAADPYDKKNALREVHQIVRDDAPMIFLWTLDSYAALSTRVKRVLIHPFYFFTYVGEWQMK